MPATIIIDAPTPFSDDQEWLDFLEEMHTIEDDADSDAVRNAAQRMIDRAEEVLMERGVAF